MNDFVNYLKALENVIFDNEQSFLDVLACAKSDEVMTLTNVSFSSERVYFVYVLHSGQHIADGCSLTDFFDWKNTL